MKNKDPLPQPDYKESKETSYCLSRRFSNLTFDETVANTRQALHDIGFEIISEMKMHEYFKQRLSKDINRYTLIGVCKAELAYELLQTENKLGVLLPCNIVIQDVKDGQLIEVSLIDAAVSWGLSKNTIVSQKAKEVKEKFKSILDKVEQSNTSI
ncbi:uncharacterized protein (DUF302 family) [Catalinimonas alkaloidigena]|uniref:DUF302 domain-containing protein n=1 Tax=Catalinimonas alkaloidigena TaxID=1075417 RepID=UPI002406A18F|nr:DUF302 domain-containing protein [Catalinimonas alkaloidigena]MDF9799187.1 uncharacterized protein (DUF302 family) [Catalinimonas alkaloidigena]